MIIFAKSDHTCYGQGHVNDLIIPEVLVHEDRFDELVVQQVWQLTQDPFKHGRLHELAEKNQNNGLFTKVYRDKVAPSEL